MTEYVLPTVYQEFIAASRYARFDLDKGRRETWHETVQRLVNYWSKKIPQLKQIPELEISDLFATIGDYVGKQKVMPSMRTLMTAGPALERSEIAAYNCAASAITGFGPELSLWDDKMPEFGIDEPITVRVRSPIVFDEAFAILLNGTGFGFSVERQFVNEMPTIGNALSRAIYKRNNANYPGVPKDELSSFDKKTNTIHVADSKYGWASALRIFIVEMYNGNFATKYDVSDVRPAGAVLKTFGGRACLTGDTLVSKDRKKTRGYNELTLKQLYEMQESKGFWEHKSNHFKDVKIRCLDEATGEFYRNDVLRVVDNGMAPVYEILTANGYRIKATDNHRFMTNTGEYDFVSNFSAGDLIAVNGASSKKTGTCVDCGAAISRVATRCKSCADDMQRTNKCSFTTARARKECQSQKKDTCENCGCTDTPTVGGISTLYIHHKDRNPLNNSPSNLVTLCAQCHSTQHAKEDTFGDAYSHKYVSYDEIISITYSGVERVYDVQMAAPNHNFVANGFVSHNSGPSAIVNMFENIRGVFKKAHGRKLTSLECHDIMCFISDAVVVGGVRRAALISLSNLSDDRMRHAKSGEWWISEPQRALANNSVAYTEKPTIGSFMQEWQALYNSKSGERGISNRQATKKACEATGRDPNHDWIFNP